MVRVRKDANVLTNQERNRFLTAFATFNSNTSEYQDFLDSHNGLSDSEIHGRPSFLPWHRAFVLDIERRLQSIDSSVTMPYWRFERTAPNVFIPQFMGGTPNGAGRVALAASNPLQSWTINGVTGIIREPGFNTNSGAPSLRTEAQTLALGASFSGFRNMEGNPHGSAHVSFTGGPIRSPGTATQDPLFFMLHCNVDRMWALWQLANNRFDAANANAYSKGSSTRAGDDIADTMWPWNNITTGTRPPTAPGGTFPPQTFPSLPSAMVTVGETIDYIGRTEGDELNFNYDDVPFI
jgi:tyrosinase